MHRFEQLFLANVAYARDMGSLYAYLSNIGGVPLTYDDLLRSQIVYGVSAFDKLMHDIIRYGMVETYLGRRIATDKYLAEGISLSLHSRLVAATVPPPEAIFEEELFLKFRHLSFQEPDKVAQGLSFVWDEAHKWNQIALRMGISEHEARTTLKLISVRRNAIVHEGDIDFVSRSKQAITAEMAKDATDFLERCGRSIVALVG